jgi:phage repressor protein C with HTH and peptisase S24 domain
MFLAQVVGKSMEPRIPNGAWCLFTGSVGGSRYGRVLLVQHNDIADPETGGQYTVKLYGRPPKVVGSGSESRGDVLLQPANPEYEPILIREGDDTVRVIAEMLEVLKVATS